MVKYKFGVVLFAILGNTPVTANAQAPELLVAVTGSEEAVVRAKNEYYLKKESYFAKRYRIVQVNTDLLMQRGEPNEQITVNFFDGVRLTYDVVDSKIPPGGNSIRFEALLTNPPLTVKDIAETDSSMSQYAAQLIYDSAYGLSLVGARYVHDKKRDRFWPVGIFNNWVMGRPIPLSKPKKLNPRHETFFAVATEIIDPFSRTKYVLKPLVSDPRYHAVIDIDDSKIFTKPDHPNDTFPWLTEESKGENTARRRAYDEFRLSLGDDPRSAAENLDLNAYRDSLDDKPDADKIVKGSSQ